MNARERFIAAAAAREIAADDLDLYTVNGPDDAAPAYLTVARALAADLDAYLIELVPKACGHKTVLYIGAVDTRGDVSRFYARVIVFDSDENPQEIHDEIAAAIDDLDPQTFDTFAATVDEYLDETYLSLEDLIPRGSTEYGRA